MYPAQLSELASQLETLSASRPLDPVALATPPLRIQPPRARPHVLQYIKAHSESITPTLIALDELQLQLDAIRRETLLQLAQHINALSPISSLPPELIREIFGFSISSPDEKLALTLAQVCQRWRAIALQQRGLWCTVEAEWSLQLQAIFMDRSGSSPIDFVVGTAVFPFQFTPTWIPRIEHLTVYDSSPISPWRLPDITPDNQGFPALENLYIVGMDILSTLGVAQTPMPRLRALWLSTRAVIDIGTANGANLTFLSLDLGNASFRCSTPKHGRRIKSLLDCCPRLQQLLIYDWYNCESSEIEETGVVLLDHLDHLTLSDFHDIAAAATLRMIKAPNLSKLLLENVSARCCYGQSGAELGDCCMTGDWSLRGEIHRKLRYDKMTDLQLRGEAHDLAGMVHMLAWDPSSCSAVAFPNLKTLLLEVTNIYKTPFDVPSRIERARLDRKVKYIGDAVNRLFKCRLTSGLLIDKAMLPSCIQDLVDEARSLAARSLEWQPAWEKRGSPVGCGYDSDDWDDDSIMEHWEEEEEEEEGGSVVIAESDRSSAEGNIAFVVE